MEFMSLGCVVISSTKVDRYYFDDSVVRFFESGNVEELAAAILELARDPERRKQQAARASAYAERHSWQRRNNGLSWTGRCVGVRQPGRCASGPLDRNYLASLPTALSVAKELSAR